MGRPGERKVREQVLRLHAQPPVVAAREAEVNGTPRHLRDRVGRIAEFQPEEKEDALQLGGIDVFPLVERIEEVCRFGVEADVPAPAWVLDAFDGPHAYLDAEEPRDPALEELRQRRRALASRREVEGEAAQRIAQEIERRVLTIETRKKLAAPNESFQ